MNEYIEKGTLHCSCDPEDYRHVDTGRDGDGQKAGTFSRMDRTALGCSVRVGCTVRFTFRRQPGTEDIVEIQYYDRQHINHGADAQVCAPFFLVRSITFATHICNMSRVAKE